MRVEMGSEPAGALVPGGGTAVKVIEEDHRHVIPGPQGEHANVSATRGGRCGLQDLGRNRTAGARIFN